MFKILLPFTITELSVVFKFILAFDLLVYVIKKYNAGSMITTEKMKSLFLKYTNDIPFLRLSAANNCMEVV